MGGGLKKAGLAIIQGPTRATRPSQVAAPAGTAGLPLASAPLPRAAAMLRLVQIWNVDPAENESVYFLPYKYYLKSSVMVFSPTRGWDKERRYDEFLTAMRENMSGHYTPREAAVVCRIFEQDMLLMFYEKAIQEISQGNFGLPLDKTSGEPLILEKYQINLMTQKANFSKRKNSSPPSEFNSSALWFATFSTQQAPYLASTNEHAGSIYFDGGRIRLMHRSGPTIEWNAPIRTLGGAHPALDKPTNAAAFDQMVRERDARGESVTLIEYDIGGTHTSRGYPKTIALIDEDIAQLYYLANQITNLQLGYHRSSGGVHFTEKDIINAGNKLMADFIRNHSRLRAALGYW